MGTTQKSKARKKKGWELVGGLRLYMGLSGRFALGREVTADSLQEARVEELAGEGWGSAKGLGQAPAQCVPEAARRSGRWSGGAGRRKCACGERGTTVSCRHTEACSCQAGWGAGAGKLCRHLK